MTNDSLLTPDAAAVQLGVSVRSLQRLTASGVVRYCRIGNNVRFRSAELERLLK